MLKHLYKTLLISMLSFSLMTMNLTVFAAEATNTSSAITGMSVAPNSGLKRDANGVLSKTEHYSFEGAKAEEGPLSIITMLAIGFVGSKIMLYKKRTIDMMVAGVGCAAYLAGEILNIMNLKKEVKAIDIEIIKKNDGNTDQTQIETLQKLKASYEAAKKSAGTRKMLQLASAAAFGSAAAIAAFQAVTGKGKLANCQAAIGSANATLAVAAASPIPSDTTAAIACVPKMAELQTTIVAAEATNNTTGVPTNIAEAKSTPIDTNATKSIATPCVGATPSVAKASAAPACATFIEDKKRNEASGAQPESPVTNTNVHKNVFQNMMEFFIPTAEASMMSLLGLGAGAAAAFFTAKTAIGMKIDSFLFNPMGRIVIWGALTAAAFMASKATQAEMDKLDGYIKKIDQILKDLNSLQKGIKTKGINEQQIKLADFGPNKAVDVPFDAKGSTDCLGTVGNSKCTPVTDQIALMPGFAELPDSIKSVTTESAKLGDGLSGRTSISGSTLKTANSLAGKNAAIAKINKLLRDKLNSGKNKTDFDKKGLALWGELKAHTSKALKANNMSPADFLASAGLPSTPSGDEAGSKAVTSKFSKNSNLQEGASNSASSAGTDLNFKEVNAENSVPQSGAGGASSKDEKFDIGTNDINTNPEESLFQLISNRYFKSGYPRLLEEVPAKN